MTNIQEEKEIQKKVTEGSTTNSEMEQHKEYIFVVNDQTRFLQ